MEKAGSAPKELVQLANSFHVATLDHDAELIRERILQFARANAPGG
jgi:esterase/lipase